MTDKYVGRPHSGGRPQISSAIAGDSLTVRVDCPRCGRRYTNPTQLARKQAGESNMAFAFRLVESERQKHATCDEGSA